MDLSVILDILSSLDPRAAALGAIVLFVLQRFAPNLKLPKLPSTPAPTPEPGGSKNPLLDAILNGLAERLRRKAANAGSEDVVVRKYLDLVDLVERD